MRSADTSERTRAADAYAKLPLAFEPNAGRTDPRVRFIARGAGYVLFLTPRESVLSLDGAAVRTRLLGTRPANIVPEARLPGVVNSYVGQVKRTGLATYGRVRYRGVYPHTDLVYYGDGGRLEYDFILRPGAEPGRLGFALSGVRAVRVAPSGDLVLRTGAGTLRELRPVAYQLLNGRRAAVTARYVVRGGTVRLRVGHYDHGRTLVIDPRLVYSTYLGGTAGEWAQGVAVDSSGDAYVVGWTNSPSDFPTATPQQPSSGGNFDAFITRIKADGSALVFSTYFGGSGHDEAAAVALDGSGGVYVTGYTASSDFTTTDAASSHHGTDDAFVVKLSSSGGLRYSTQIGGSTFTSSTWHSVAYTDGEAIAVDPGGNAYVTGHTNTSDLAGGVSGSLGDTLGDAWVAKFAPNASVESQPVHSYAIYVGGNSIEWGQAIAVDGSGHAFVAGRTYSSNLTSAANSNSGLYDGFVVKVNSTGTGFDLSRYLGGAGNDNLAGVAVDGSGNIYVAGGSDGGFPTSSSGVLQSTFPTGATSAAVVAKLDPTKSATANAWITWATYVGAAGYTGATGLALDSQHNAYVSGETTSGGLTAVNAPQPSNAGSSADTATPGGDGIAFKLNASGSALVYLTYLGGRDVLLDGSDYGDSAKAIATGPNGIATVVGYSYTTTFPTANAFQSTEKGRSDGFVTKLQPLAATVSGPSGPDASTDANFTFSAESGDTYECSLDGANPPTTACTSPQSFSGLAPGAHTFRVQAFDSGGTSDGSVTTNSFFVDTAAPSAPGLVSPDDGAAGLSFSPTFTWTEASDPAPSSGIDHYELDIDDHPDSNVPTSSCSGGTCSATPASALAEGSHTWRVRAVDAAGNSTPSGTRSFRSFGQLTAVLVVSPNPALAGSTVTFDGSSSKAPGATITDYAFDFDGNGSYEADNGAAPIAHHIYGAPATVNVGLRVTTAGGQTAATSVPLKVTSQPANTQFGVSVNRGAQFTNDPNVVVTAVFPAPTTALLFSNDGGFFDPVQFAAQRETHWKLDSSGSERLPKIVYVRFLIGSIVSETHTDDIILDQTPPKVQNAAVAPAAATTSAAARAAALRKWRVKVKATDTNSGVGKIQVTANKRKPGKLLAYRRKLTVKSAARPKWVRARDKAGNFSRWRRAK